jgi:hypothetical protein
MDNYSYNKKKLQKLPLKCSKFNSWIDIITITGGSGGSQSIILIGIVDDVKIVLKCTPIIKKQDFMKEPPNNDLVEIEIYKYLTKKYLDHDITPHIVGIYQHKKCNDIIKFFKKKCPSMLDLLTNKKAASTNDRICNFNQRIDIFQKELHLLLLEYCPLNIDDEFRKLIKKYKNKRITIKELEDFIYRVIFQILFTLAQLQKNEKQFYHRDLFLRNILGVNECSKDETDYVEYIFGNKRFYLPANGFYAKISDFGMSIVSPKFISNRLPSKESYKDNNSDVFNFIRDIYDGANFGANSLMTIARDNKLSKGDITKLKNIFKNFIDVKMIDKTNNINKRLIDRTWNIKKYPFLKKMVKEPNQYMSYNFFNRYKELPKGCNVIKTYGKNPMKGGNREYREYIKCKNEYIRLKNLMSETY